MSNSAGDGEPYYIRYIQHSFTIGGCIESSERPLLCLQCAAPNGGTASYGTYIRLRVEEEACQKKMASVLEAIRRVDYMLWWVVSIFVSDVFNQLS